MINIKKPCNAATKQGFQMINVTKGHNSAENVQIAKQRQYTLYHRALDDILVQWKFGQNPSSNVAAVAHKRNCLCPHYTSGIRFQQDKGYIDFTTDSTALLDASESIQFNICMTLSIFKYFFILVIN